MGLYWEYGGNMVGMSFRRENSGNEVGNGTIVGMKEYLRSV